MNNYPKVAEALKRVLADSYTIYIKTHNYHWNVTGPNFQSLHLLFEAQYTDLSTAVDDIAERIRTLGELAPGSCRDFAKLTNLTEAAEGKTTADDMVKDLASDQEKIIETLKSALHTAQEVEDESTIGLITERMAIHEKNHWMLQSSL